MRGGVVVLCAFLAVPLAHAQQQQQEAPALQAAQRAFRGPDLEGKDGPFAKVGMDLAQLYYRHRAFRRVRAQGAAGAFRSGPSSAPVQNGRVLIDAVAAESAEALRARLEALGLGNGATAGPVVSGWLPIEELWEAAQLEALRFARPSVAQVRGRAGRAVLQQDAPVISQGVEAMNVAAARDQYGVEGRDVRVGILSDSYDCQGEAAGDVEAGELPSDVIIEAAEPECASGTDEGRAMAQIVFDVAPRADISFNTAFGGIAGFANGIERLADQGSSVIVDDVIYFAEPMFADGVIAQAVDRVVEGQDVAYFSAAGNSGDQAYESAFRPSGQQAPLSIGGTLHDFNPGSGTEPYQQITVPLGATITFSFQWAQPYATTSTSSPGASSDLDIFIASQAGDTLAVGTFPNVGRDPVEVFEFVNDDSTDANGDGEPDTSFRLGISLLDGPAPEHMKYIYSSDDIITIRGGSLGGSTLYGHANASGAEAVGATVYYYTPAFGIVESPVINPYSALGGTAIYFDENGNRLPEPETRRQPGVVGPDGSNTTFFGSDFPNAFPGDGGPIPGEDDDWPNFTGTSAAAPHVAGVAALMRNLNADVGPAQLYQYLEETATDMDSIRNGVFDPGDNNQFVGFDFKTGYGFVNALAALEAVPSSLLLDVAATRSDAGTPQVNVTLTTRALEQAEQFVIERCLGACGADDDGYREVQVIPATGDSTYTATLSLPTPGRYTFRVRQENQGGVEDFVRTAEVEVDLQSEFALTEVYPNPFQRRAELNLVTQETQSVRAELYDALGRHVKTIYDETVPPSRPVSIAVEASALSSGVYFVRVEGDNFFETRSAVLVR